MRRDTSASDLVVANRILANENVLDAYGHVGVPRPNETNVVRVSDGPLLRGLEWVRGGV